LGLGYVRGYVENKEGQENLRRFKVPNVVIREIMERGSSINGNEGK
jgi:hypothetical protein